MGVSFDYIVFPAAHTVATARAEKVTLPVALWNTARKLIKHGRGPDLADYLEKRESVAAGLALRNGLAGERTSTAPKVGRVAAALACVHRMTAEPADDVPALSQVDRATLVKLADLMVGPGAAQGVLVVRAAAVTN